MLKSAKFSTGPTNASPGPTLFIQVITAVTVVVKSKLSTVKINATASPEGSKTYNQKLSERRAEAVKNYLTERNVTVVEATGLGVESKESNRIAMVTIQ